MSCPKQEAFRPQPQTSRKPRHPTVPAVPTANATGTHCHPCVQKGLPRPCTHLHLTTKGITRLGWKSVHAQARKGAQRISGGSGLCTVTGPAHSATRRPWQHSARTAVCALSRGGHRGQAAPEPAANSSGSGPGQPLCPRRDGDWAAAPRDRALPLLASPVPPRPPLCDTHTRQQQQAPDPEAVPED